MKKIETTMAPKAIGPYSQAIQAGNMILVSGQLPIDRVHYRFSAFAPEFEETLVRPFSM